MLQGQVVDTLTAAEFTRLALERVSSDELGAVAGQLEEKSAAFGQLLAPERVGELTSGEATDVLRSVFSARRRAKLILDTLTLEGFRREVTELLWGADPMPGRLQRFHETIVGVGRGVPDSTGYDLGSELLHFTRPASCWLWTRWMWDPATGKGSLPLVVMDEVDLTGTDVAETYERVGIAVAFVDEVGGAAGFKAIGHGVFGTDVFLASVYGMYVYTTLRLRMTQEFSKIMPELGELVRRLLGVHNSPLIPGRTE